MKELVNGEDCPTCKRRYFRPVTLADIDRLAQEALNKALQEAAHANLR